MKLEIGQKQIKMCVYINTQTNSFCTVAQFKAQRIVFRLSRRQEHTVLQSAMIYRKM